VQSWWLGHGSCHTLPLGRRQLLTLMKRVLLLLLHDQLP
jgi:hypothetical protein